jgi:hypothetical protein
MNETDRFVSQFVYQRSSITNSYVNHISPLNSLTLIAVNDPTSNDHDLNIFSADRAPYWDIIHLYCWGSRGRESPFALALG